MCVQTFVKKKCFIFSIDATEDNHLGRFVNDSPSKDANCVIRTKIFDNKPYLCIYAKKDIKKGDELRYDYGGTYGAESKKFWWRKEVKCFIL